MADSEGWDEEIELSVVVRVQVRPNPEYFEGWLGRTAAGLAASAVSLRASDPAKMDGYADLTGDVDIVSVETLYGDG